MEQIKTTKPLYKACAKLRTCLAMIAVGMFFGTQQAASQPANAIPVDLRCNYQTTPLCIASAPNLSWKTQTKEKGWLQSAYRILVATSQEKLNKGRADVWDSGKTIGGTSVSILYQGQKLQPRRSYWWKVCVWDNKGRLSKWSKTTFFETSMLTPTDWSATWIGHTDVIGSADLQQIKWIWLPAQNAFDVPRKTIAWFRKTLNIEHLPQTAYIQTTVRGDYELSVNGAVIDKKDKGWQSFERQDLLPYLHKGENNIEVKVNATRTASFTRDTRKTLSGSYAGFAGILVVEDHQERRTYPTSEGQWACRPDNASNWETATVSCTLDDPRMGLNPGALVAPAILLRKNFVLNKPIKAARLYATALGSYEMFVNGQRTGGDYFTPEFTNYNKRIIYQTYDVTRLLHEGENAIGSLLGDGWYGSPLGWNGENDLFEGKSNKLIAELHVTFTDGTTVTIPTDGSWKTAVSPILKSEIYSGEYYDARLEQEKWNEPSFNDVHWRYAEPMGDDYTKLFPQNTAPVRAFTRLSPKHIYKTPDNRWIIDMGQNLAGITELRLKGEAGTAVVMRFAERLATPDSIYTDNLRNATAKDCYVLKGGEATYRQHFTFHGFRYIEVSGYPGVLSDNDVSALVLSSVGNKTGRVETSSDIVNHMYSLGIWGQLGNFISVPTDCPQRDERLGYTGDGQVFWRTGSYNFDIASFTHKWMNDIKDEQTAEGGVTNTAPAVPMNNRKNGSPGWEDAAVIVPWSSWMQFGDKSIITENWQAMTRFMNYVICNSKGYNRDGGYLGDWLCIDKTTPNGIISNSLWAMMAEMMKQMAQATGHTTEATAYEALHDSIAKTFQRTFVKADGTVGSGSQTCYALALYAGLIPDNLKKAATDKLVKAIEANQWHLTTGFLGTPRLLFALSQNGRTDVAYRLLTNETFPSWGYMVRQGATTWWEHWDSDKSDPKMNSFNHYSFGAVAEWMYRAMAGINTTPEAPGYKEIIISPVFDTTGRLTSAKGEYESVYGKIVSEWEMRDNKNVTLRVTIPANTTAKVKLPAGASFPNKNDKVRAGKLKAGTYRFEVRLQ